MTWLMEDAIEPGIGVSIAEMTINPRETSELHRHNNCSEIIYVMTGQISQRIGEEWVELKAGDHCIIPPHHAHQTRNEGREAAKMLLVYSEGQRNYQRLG